MHHRARRSKHDVYLECGSRHSIQNLISRNTRAEFHWKLCRMFAPLEFNKSFDHFEIAFSKPKSAVFSYLFNTSYLTQSKKKIIFWSCKLNKNYFIFYKKIPFQSFYFKIIVQFKPYFVIILWNLHHFLQCMQNSEDFSSNSELKICWSWLVCFSGMQTKLINPNIRAQCEGVLLHFKIVTILLKIGIWLLCI